MRKNILIILSVFLLISLVSAAFPVTFYDQGNGVRTVATGEILTTGDITIEIYDDLTAGNLIYSETFVGGVKDGAWNLILGANPSNQLYLEYGKRYYRDYSINGVNLNFVNYLGEVSPRKLFYSPLGTVPGSGIFVGTTNSSYSGLLSYSGLSGYLAGNAICNSEFRGSHICNQAEIIATIQTMNVSSISDWEENSWISSGGSKFPDALTAADCRGFTVGDSSALGNFWIFDKVSGGQGSIVNCGQLKTLACCR